MKRIALSILFLATSGALFSQLGGLRNKVNQKVNQKVDQQVDKQIDKAIDGPKKDKSKSGDNQTSSGEENSSSGQAGTETPASGGASKAATPAFASYSKFDFLPGEKVIAFDDFATDNIGDFPAKWNTDGSGEVVTVNTMPGKWFAMGQNGYYRPEYITNSLPDNFTVEFDLAMMEENNSGGFYVQLGNAKQATGLYPDGSGISVEFITSGDNYIVFTNWCYLDDCKGTTAISNTNNYHFGDKGEKMRVSIWRQKQRVRVYVNDTKLFDLPRALDASIPINCLSFRSAVHETSKYAFITNLRVAAGAPDTRNKLISEGKFVTSGILFDVGSDKIRPESYGIIKDIANVLKENADVKVKIVGHTDSDGDDAKNMDLSAKRAAAVKVTLSKEFGVEENRMQTEGKGETQPTVPNTTPEGKANNRRVEFIKL